MHTAYSPNMPYGWNLPQSKFDQNKKNLNPSCSQTQDGLVKKRQSHANFPLILSHFIYSIMNAMFFMPYFSLCVRVTVWVYLEYLCARVAIFREKKYSTEHGTDGNFDSFRWNSACFEERKTLGILFQAIPRKIRKTQNSVPNHFV